MSQEKNEKREFKSASELEKTIKKLFHDLNGCSSIFQPGVEIIKEYILTTPNSDEKKDVLEVINAVQEAVTRQTKILGSGVNDLYLESAKTTTEVVGLKKMLDDTYNFFKFEAEKKNLKLMQNYSYLDELKMETNVVLLERVLQNVVGNAVKYTDLGFVELGCKYFAKSNEVQIKVRDTGIGIPKEDLKNVFEYGSRACNVGEKEGTGLGLNTVKESVEKLGGSINIESKVNSGTTVYINIPLKLVE